MSTNSVANKKSSFVGVLKGALVAVSTTLILILLFALIVRFFNVSDKWIFPINQVIKVISLILGVIVILKSSREKGFVKGLILGLTYFILSFVIFSILQASFKIGIKNIYDLILTTLMGGLIGIIVVNIKK